MRLLYTLTAYPPYVGGAQLLQHGVARQLQGNPQNPQVARPVNFSAALSEHTLGDLSANCWADVKVHSSANRLDDRSAEIKTEIQVVSHWDRHRTDWLLGTTLRAPSSARDYQVDGIAVHRLGITAAQKRQLLPWVLAYYPAMQQALPRIAAGLATQLQPYAQRADLVHNVRIGREALTEASYQVARKQNIPFVLTPVHHPRWVGWRYREYLRLYRSADALIALTQAEKRVLIELGVQPDRVHVTGMGPVLAEPPEQIAPTEFIRRYGLSAAAPIVLFLGQHYDYKGYRQVLQAATTVWRRIPEAQFVFIGPAVKQSERAFVEHADRRIHRLGQVDLPTKTAALAACTALCVPSSQESFGGVYTEAWSFGKPVIGCRIPAVSEVIDDGVNGYLVDQEPAEIADRLIALLSQPAQAQALGAAGQAKVAAHFTWPQIAAKTAAVYRGLLK
jgi:glycosyltransferase involved in cell wall biosynthesis